MEQCLLALAKVAWKWFLVDPVGVLLWVVAIALCLSDEREPTKAPKKRKKKC